MKFHSSVLAEAGYLLTKINVRGCACVICISILLPLLFLNGKRYRPEFIFLIRFRISSYYFFNQSSKIKLIFD